MFQKKSFPYGTFQDFFLESRDMNSERGSDGRFESDQKPTTPGESCGSSTIR